MQTKAIPYFNRSGRQVKGKYTEEDISKICQDNGITYIDGYTTSMNTFNCICSCGQEWTTWLRNIKEGRKCRTHLFIKESRIIEICNSFDIVYKDRKDLALSLDNSITLCSNCHYKLHSKYGINVGINNLNLFLGVENE